MNTEHFAKILKNHFQQLSLFLYIYLFRLIALTLLEPSTSLIGALCSSDKHSRSTSLLPLSLAHCFAHMLPHFLPQDCQMLGCCFTTIAHLSPQDSPLSCCPLSYIRLIAHLETSTWHWIILLKHLLCHSYSCGYVWYRLFYFFLAWDGSRHDITGLAGHHYSRGYSAVLHCSLLIPSILQVWHQSVQVDNHHLFSGVLLNPIYDVVDLGDDEVGTFSAHLQLG